MIVTEERTDEVLRPSYPTNDTPYDNERCKQPSPKKYYAHKSAPRSRLRQ